MKRLRLPVLAAAAARLALPLTGLASSGNASPTLSFFSGGDGAHADWLATTDQPAGDTDNQAIRLLTVNDAPTFSKGYAGILVHHVTGIPAAQFPDSSFWVKTPDFTGASLGSPRLVVAFQTAAGTPDGYADLRPLTLTPTWQYVTDQPAPTTAGWDVMNTLPTNPCPFRYNVDWTVVQTCFAADTTRAVYLTTDPYGIYHLIDDISVDGKTFSSASDNGDGINDAAGPDATTDLSLLPPLDLLPA